MEVNMMKMKVMSSQSHGRFRSCNKSQIKADSQDSEKKSFGAHEGGTKSDLYHLHLHQDLSEETQGKAEALSRSLPEIATQSGL